MNVSTAVTSFAPPSRDFYRDLRFPQVFEAAAIGIALCHFDGRILEGNSALARLLGCEQAELAGLDPWKFHETDSTAASVMLAGLLHGERNSFAVEKLCRRIDATEFWARLTVSLARDAQHDPAFLIVLLEDTTERTRLEQQLRQSEKMEIIGRLTGSIAHDFNNLLTGFLLYCDLMLAELAPGDPIRRNVEEMRQAGEQGSALTRQLLAFARKQAPQPRLIAINQIVTSTENLLRRLIGEQIELVTTLDPNTSQVFADPGQLRQVLLNLALNARDALNQGGGIHGGRIQVRTHGTNFAKDPQLDAARPAVSLIVEDNGCGMTPETRAHLFEPFFTTKKPEEGTGMGLATVQRIVTEAGGEIEICTEANQGTSIKIVFPAAEIAPTTGEQSPNDFVTRLLDKQNGDQPC